MQFSTGHGFVQAQTHRVCQDYTTASIVTGRDLTVRHNPLIIVSDGCSDAPDSDVGARIVSLSARRILELKIAQQIVPDTETLGKEILEHSLAAAKALGVREISCAATLLTGFVLDGNCHIYVFGDGVWFRRLRNAELHFTTVESSEMVGYLAVPTWGDQPVLTTEFPSGASSSRATRHFQEHWSFPSEETVEFGVATDGVQASDRSTRDVLEALTGNRIEYLIDRFLATNPVLNDDIGIASIRIEH